MRNDIRRRTALLDIRDKVQDLEMASYAGWLVSVSKSGNDFADGIEANARSWMAYTIFEKAKDLGRALDAFVDAERKAAEPPEEAA